MANKPSKSEKLSINYFKKTDTLKFVGGGILIAGLICLWIGIGWVGFILAILGTPTGLVLFLIGASGRATDADMESAITNKMAGLYLDLDGEKKYQLRLLKHHKTITFQGYRYGNDVMIKKLKDASLRTSLFCRSQLRILSDSVYIVSREISLINDDTQNNSYEIFYDSIKAIEIERSQERVIFNNNTFYTKPCYLHIVWEENEIRLPITDAITSDELVDSITRQMKIYQEQKNT